MAETKNTSFRQLLLDFTSFTTSHGLGRLTASTTVMWKLFWTISCLGAFVMFVFQVYSLFQLYLARPVQTYVTMEFEKQLKFPAVTICNLNMIRSNTLPNELNDVFTLNETYQDAKYPQVNITRGNKEKSEVSEFDYSDYLSNEQTKAELANSDAYQEILEEYPGESEVDESTKLRHAIELLIGSQDVIKLSSHGHLMKDLIQSCIWKSLDCKNGNISQYWTRSWNYKYGNCYTFNNGIDKNGKTMRVLKASKPGPSNGLSLELDIEQSLYIGALTPGAGVRVALHEQGVIPFPHEDGFSVGPGMATSVALRKTVIKRLDRFDNEDCLEDPSFSERNIYRKFRNITAYSQQGCLNSCLGNSQWYTCGCSESAYPSGKIPCDTFNKGERNCLRLIKHLFNSDRLACTEKCKVPCRQDVYLKTISSSEWPSAAYKIYSESQSTNSNESRSGKSTLQLNIFYSELNYETVEEKLSYTTTNLLADIGGLLGLWIGISVLTVCELLELILKFITLAFTKLKKRHNHVTEIRQGK